MNLRVRMLQTRQGMRDATHGFKYEAGKSYWIPKSLAMQYFAQGIAMEDKMIDVKETKGKKKRKIL